MDRLSVLMDILDFNVFIWAYIHTSKHTFHLEFLRIMVCYDMISQYIHLNLDDMPIHVAWRAAFVHYINCFTKTRPIQSRGGKIAIMVLEIKNLNGSLVWQTT